MISFPPCKINLGLHVLSKRADGYHNIETCFYPVQWNDILEIVPAKETKLYLSGNEVPGDHDSNIVLKAFYLLKEEFNLRPVEIYLHKIIPHGAGLGGGSSDGAHTLKLLNHLLDLQLSVESLKEFALKLGSDCPFFIEALPMLARGRGELHSPISISLKGLYLLIVKPPIHVSTQEAYQGLSLKKPAVDIGTILREPISKWKSLLINDFEDTVFEKYPMILEVKNQLYQQGALYASMSGSGSAVYGFFENQIDFKNQFEGMVTSSTTIQ